MTDDAGKIIPPATADSSPEVTKEQDLPPGVKKTGLQQLIDIARRSVVLIAVVSGLVTIVALFASHGWRTWLLGIALTAGLLLSAACLVPLFRKNPLSMTAAVFGLCLIVSTVSLMLLLHPGARAGNTVPSSSMSLSNPHHSPQDPLPVQCVQQIEVSGSVPNGYVFAMGNIITGRKITNSEPVFTPEETRYETSPGSNIWKVPQTFGVSSDAGAEFTVYLVVMPTVEANYLIGGSQQARIDQAQFDRLNLPNKLAAARNYVSAVSGQTWWTGAGLPSFSQVRDIEYAKRAPGSRC